MPSFFRAAAAALFCVLLHGLTAQMRAVEASKTRPAEIRVVIDNNYPPFAFLDENGGLQGILVDRWHLFQEKTGLKVTLTGCDWDAAMRRMAAGEYDVIDTIFKTVDRETWLEFSKPHTRLEVCIFFDADITGITTLASARDFPVAAKAGDFGLELARLAGVRNLNAYPNYESIVSATAENKVHVFVMDKPPALYFLHKYGQADSIRYSKPVHIGEFHRAVRKADKALLSAIEQGFAAISGEESAQIEEKWTGHLSKTGVSMRAILAVCGAGLLIAIVLVGWNQMLRWQVNKRTLALRESEKRFHDALDFMPVALGIADDKAHIIYLNKEFSRRYGYDLSDLPDIGTWARKAYPDDAYRAELQKTWDADAALASATGETTPVRLCNITCKDGSSKATEILMRPIGRLFLTCFNDVSERRRLEDQLVQSQKLEAIGQLAGGVAHDFNNLLASMLLNVSLLQSDHAGNPELLHALSEVRAEIEKAADLTRQLLAFGRRQSMHLTSLRLDELLARQTKMLKRLLGESIQVEFLTEDALPPVMGNPGMLEQVVMNLALNARDAMGSGGRLTLRTRRVELDQETADKGAEIKPGSYVELGIEDNGAGMSDEVRRRIFEPFFTTKELGRGTGLGLSIVFGIIKQHGGWIDVESKQGHGSSFKIHLPIAKGPSLAAENVSPRQAGKPKNEAILLVEDEASVRSALYSGLVRLGYRVSAVAGPVEALDLWRQHSMGFDLLLTDMIMPGPLTGLNLAKTLSRQKPSLRVILSSGYSQEMQGIEADALPHLMRLSKPYTIDKLAIVLREALDS